MKQNLEIEYKTLLDPTTYDTLLSAWDFSDGVNQINIYLDTPSHDLYNLKMMCRLRLTDTIEFTLKVPQEDGVLEHELILDSFDLSENEAIRSLMNDFSIDVEDLIEVARSTTLRRTFDDKYGTWCLDYTVFNHGEDYEIEYELFNYHPDAFEHYVNKLSKMGIEYKKSRPKYIRARFPD